MKILVIGGTRYFGRKLVHMLVQEGHQVWCLSRGRVADDFGSSVHRLTADRNDAKAFQQVVQGLSFDVVVDQVCMTAEQIRISLQALQGHFKKYILTSTLSVYDWGDSLSETLVNPLDYEPRSAQTPPEQYAEGKRAAEQALVKGVGAAWAVARFPVVFGPDDFTWRLRGQVQRVLEGQPLYYPNLDAQFSFITSEDAARALRWLSVEDRQGVYNFASADVLTLRELVAMIEGVTGKKAHLLEEASEDAWSPFGVPFSWTLDVSKACKEGFEASSVNLWLKPLLELYVRELASQSSS